MGMKGRRLNDFAENVLEPLYMYITSNGSLGRFARELAEKLYSVARKTPEYLGYGDPLSAILFLYSKTSRKVLEHLYQVTNSGAETLDLDELSRSGDFSAEKLAYGLVLGSLVAVINDAPGYLDKDIEGALRRIDLTGNYDDLSNTVYIRELLIKFSVDLKRLVEAYLKHIK